MAAAELKINVGDLDAGGKQFTFALRAAWIRGILEDHEATPAGADGELDVRASRSGNDVVVHGTLRAELEVPCARCLKPVPLLIQQQLSLLFVPGKVTPPPRAPRSPGAPAKSDDRDAPAQKRRGRKHADEVEEYELSSEDADTLPYDGEVILLDDVVRDELILETPIFPLCSEDCPGMSAPPGESAEAADPKAARAPEGGDAEIDPRLRPLLRLKTNPTKPD
jgi:uncharacterized protein